MRLSCLFICLMCLSVRMFAQKLLEESVSSKGRYTIQYWKTEEGLPQNTVLSLVQDSNGSLWILTYSGVTRYDGNSFQTFNESNTSLLADKRLKALSLNSRGHPVVTTDGGTYHFDPLKKVFAAAQYRGLDILFDGLMADNTRYFATASGEVFMKPGNGKVVSPGKIPCPINGFTAIENKLYAATDCGIFQVTAGGISRLKAPGNDTSSCQFLDRQSIYPLSYRHSGARIGRTAPGANNQLFFFKTCDQEFIYAWSTTASAFRQIKLPTGSGVVHDVCYNSFTETLWIATSTGAWFDNGSGFEKLSFLNDECYSLITDMEHHTWVGSKSGLYLLKPKLFYTYSQAEGLAPDGIGGVTELRNGEILIGNSNCGGLFSLKNEKISKTRFKELHNLCIWSLYENKTGDVYVGASFGVLYKISGNSCILIPLPEACRNSAVLSLYEDGAGKLWIGTGNGLFIRNQAGQIREHLHPRVAGEVLQIFPDSRNRLWIGTTRELWRVEGGAWLRQNDKTGLRINYIRSFYEDSDHNIWIGTRGEGLLLYNQGMYSNFDDSGGRIQRDVWSITEDNRGYLWMSSNQGITAASRSDLISFAGGKTTFLNIRRFDRTDGMLSTEFNGGFMPSVINDRNGRIWFPGVKGLTVVDPARVDFSPVSVPIIIEKVIVDGVEYLPSKGVIALSSAPAGVIVQYSAPVFGRGKDLFFQTSEDGKVWSGPTASRTVEIRRPAPGTYNFRVKLYGNYRPEINREAGFILQVPPPFWKNPYIIVVISALALLCAIAIAWFRIRYIRRQNAERQNLDRQFAALELKALQSQMNPHFIFNCLNSIKYFIAAQDEESAGRYLHSFSRLLRMVLENADNTQIALSEEEELLKLYVELQQMRFDKKISFSIRNEIAKPERVFIPTMLLQPFVENAIIHGLMPLEEQARLDIAFISEKPGLLTCIIADNGIGREASAARRHSSNKPMGVSLTQGRIDLLNHFNGYEITLEITDTNPSGANPGTTVKLKIPVKTAAYA